MAGGSVVDDRLLSSVFSRCMALCPCSCIALLCFPISVLALFLANRPFFPIGESVDWRPSGSTIYCSAGPRFFVLASCCSTCFRFFWPVCLFLFLCFLSFLRAFCRL